MDLSMKSVAKSNDSPMSEMWDLSMKSVAKSNDSAISEMWDEGVDDKGLIMDVELFEQEITSTDSEKPVVIMSETSRREAVRREAKQKGFWKCIIQEKTDKDDPIYLYVDLE